MFDFLPGRKKRPPVVLARKKGGRPPGSGDKTPRKRRTAMEIEAERFLRGLQESDPQMYRQLMLQRIGLGASDGNENRDEIDNALALLGKLDKLDKLRGRKGGEDGGGADVIVQLADTQFGAALGNALAPTLTRALPALRAATTPGSETTRTAAATLPAAQAEAEQAPELDTKTVIHFVLSNLRDRTPQDAAAWLLSCNDGYLRELCVSLRDWPDERLPELLGEIAKALPEAQPLTNWLAARREWTASLAQEIRARTPADA